jgi:hypothetical protein
MSINFGDRVKVITVNSHYEGQSGKVVRVYEDGQTCLVRLDNGLTSGFFVRELEVLSPAGTEAVEVRLSAEDGFTVTLFLTPAERRGVEKLVEAAKELLATGNYPYAPDIELKG